MNLRGRRAQRIQADDSRVLAGAWIRKGRIIAYLHDRQWGLEGLSQRVVQTTMYSGKGCCWHIEKMEWWDADRGTILRQQELQHAGGPIILTVPPFQRHIACKIIRLSSLPQENELSNEKVAQNNVGICANYVSAFTGLGIFWVRAIICYSSMHRLTTIPLFAERLQETTNTVRMVVDIPADAPIDLGIGLYLCDEDGRWHQITLPTCSSARFSADYTATEQRGANCRGAHHYGVQTSEVP